MPLTEAIGIPCVAHVVPAPVTFVGKYVNGEAAIMNHSGWLLSPSVDASPACYGATGSFVVVRRDGKPLLPSHFEAMARFSSEHLLRNRSQDGAAKVGFAEWYRTWAEVMGKS